MVPAVAGRRPEPGSYAQLRREPGSSGEIVAIYGTGEGAATPAVPDGGINNSVYPRVLKIGVRIGGQDAAVVYAGAARGAVAGLFQIMP